MTNKEESFIIENEISEIQLKDILKKTTNLLYKNDKYLIIHKEDSPKLLEKHTSERSIVFRFAYYLQYILNKSNFLTNLTVDCEYNRKGYNIKKLPGSDTVKYPDLIIHHRGIQKGNYLVIEFKTWWNSDSGNDEDRIDNFLNENGYFKYKFGISLIIEESEEEVINQIEKNLKHQSG